MARDSIFGTMMAATMQKFKTVVTDNEAWGNKGLGLSVLHGHVLGFLLGVGVMLVYMGTLSVGFYLAAIGVFHMAEFYLTSFFHPDTLSIDSFLVNHSTAFWVAMIGSWVEYLVELYLFPSLKGMWVITVLGMLAVIAGQGLRSYAMWHAGVSFTHLVADDKRDEHTLVTDGIYSYIRHPSYSGFFIWSVATQVVLVNPICIVGFAAASYFFFADRIPDEEEHLIRFFGDQYVQYRNRVPSGVPLIK